jgi:hypothetical protein
MDGFRNVIAGMAVSVPPAVIHGFVIHPFAGFWRRPGTKPALVILRAALQRRHPGLLADPRRVARPRPRDQPRADRARPRLYVMAALLFPAQHRVAVIEERELRVRCDAEHRAYMAAVPRLSPRLWRS